MLDTASPPARRFDARRSAVAWDAFARSGLPARSFRKQAILACLLYFPFFLPGLIASAVWWSEANTIERRTGIAPAGKGCLTALLLFGLVSLMLWLLAFGLL